MAILGVGSFVLFRGLDYPGMFAGQSGALDAGPERDQAIAAWSSRYMDVGLPFSVAAAAATVGWLLSLHRPRLLFAVVAYGIFLAVAGDSTLGRLFVLLLFVPAMVIALIPWQAVVIVLIGAAAVAVVVRPSRPLFGLQLGAVYLCVSWQVIFITLSAYISKGPLD